MWIAGVTSSITTSIMIIPVEEITAPTNLLPSWSSWRSYVVKHLETITRTIIVLSTAAVVYFLAHSSKRPLAATIFEDTGNAAWYQHR